MAADYGFIMVLFGLIALVVGAVSIKNQQTPVAFSLGRAGGGLSPSMNDGKLQGTPAVLAGILLIVSGLVFVSGPLWMLIGGALGEFMFSWVIPVGLLIAVSSYFLGSIIGFIVSFVCAMINRDQAKAIRPLLDPDQEDSELWDQSPWR